MSSIARPEASSLGPAPASDPRGRVGRIVGAFWLSVAVLLLGVLVTLLSWDVTRGLVQQAEARRFEYRTSRMVGDLRQGLEADEVLLRSVAALFPSEGGISRAHWRDPFDTLERGARSPGRLWLSFAQRVPAAERENHERQARLDGLTGYGVRATALQSDYYPLAEFRAFGTADRRPLGLDLLEEPLARQAMARAAHTGAIEMVGPLTLPLPKGRGGQVWALLMPVYDTRGQPRGPQPREGALLGYLVEGIDPMRMVEASVGQEASAIGLRVRDGNVPVFTSPELLQRAGPDPEGSLRRVAQVDFGQRRWDIEFLSLPGFELREGADQAWVVLALGFVISGLVAGLLGSLASMRFRALSLVDESTSALTDALRQQAQSEARLRAMFDQALDAFITIDGGGIVQSFNPAAERMFGWRADEVVGRNVQMLMPSPDQERHDSYLRNYLGGGPPRIIGIGRLVTGLRKDGSQLPLDLAVSEITVSGQRLFSGVMRDVTERLASERVLREERAQLEQRVQERTAVLTRTNDVLQEEINERRRVEAELVAAREQALQAAEAKANFLANMSHEIRMPMNAVIGMTALLADTGLDAEQRSYVQTIHTSGDALLSTINDILDFSKAESGMVELEQRPFEVGVCVEQALDILAPRAADKDIDLLVEIMDDVPHWIVGDATRLRQVLVNLLSNAVKFTERGEVCLTASVLRREVDQVRLCFAVRDTGIGIAPQQRQHLFKAFSQGDASMTRRYGGTGLGLAISARLVRGMGGEFRVESEERKGSTFSFTIEAGTAPGIPAGRLRAARAPELAGRRVLLVDDNASNLRILRGLCERWGMEVQCAGDGSSALALLQAHRFDLALVDLYMPGMDGLQLAQEIAAQHGPAAPPLVLLSTSPPRSRDPDAMKLFAAALAKPVKQGRLFALLDEVIHQRGATPAPASAGAIDPTLAARVPLAILVVEDSEINRRLAVTMLRKFGYACDVAVDGADAVEKVCGGRYDLVFMDLQMPVMDGLEATRRIVATLSPPQRPRIVAMTANALPADRQRCLAAGMDDYIAKPILPHLVQQLIERWGAPQGAGDADQDLLDERILQELAALDDPGSPSLLRNLLADYVRETRAALDTIKLHVQHGEAACVRQRAHKLAGTSASLGVRAVAEVCYRIEAAVKAEQTEGLAALVQELESRFGETGLALQRYLA